MFARTTAIVGAILLAAATVAAQPPPPPPSDSPPLWDAQIGASFLGTSGNTHTTSAGIDLAAHRRGIIWDIQTTGTAIRATDNGNLKADRYLGALRVRRSLTDIVGLSAGERAERDHLSGIDFRSILDAGLSWKLVRSDAWTVDGITSVAWNHENRLVGENIDDTTGLFQLLSRIPFNGSGETTQRFTLYPDLRNANRYRQEAEVTAQAAMAAHLALKFGFLLRYSHEPVPGFKKTDTTTTASVVLRWKSSLPAPAP